MIVDFAEYRNGKLKNVGSVDEVFFHGVILAIYPFHYAAQDVNDGSVRYDRTEDGKVVSFIWARERTE